MAKIHRQSGYYVEYLQINAPSRFQEHNSHREKAMACARKTDYATRVWVADGHAVQEDILRIDESGYYHIDTILFLINPYLICEILNEDLFEG